MPDMAGDSQAVGAAGCQWCGSRLTMSACLVGGRAFDHIEADALMEVERCLAVFLGIAK